MLFAIDTAEKIKTWLSEELEDMINQLRSTPTFELEKTESCKRTSFEDMMADMMADINQNTIPLTRIVAGNKASVMVTDYLSQPALDLSSCPYEYWNSHLDAFSELASLAKKYLSAPLGSIESERLFSTASQTVTPLRTLLAEETLEKLLFLHHNLKIVEYDY